MTRTAVRALLVTLVAGGLALGTASPVSAHVGITPSTTQAGATAEIELNVPHGCEGSATTALTVQIPTGVGAVVPTRNGSWDVETEVVQLTQPVNDGHGNQITERVASVTYRAKEPLPDGVRDVLSMTMQLPDEAGIQLWFPTIQRCQKGESAWIEVAQDGQDEADLELPAPTLIVTDDPADGDDDHDHGSSTSTTESSDASDASGADPQRADSAGAAWASPVLSIAGMGLGLLGAVLGGTALLRQHRRA